MPHPHPIDPDILHKAHEPITLCTDKGVTAFFTAGPPIQDHETIILTTPDPIEAQALANVSIRRFIKYIIERKKASLK